MHPAFSVIFFTTASGAGYGLLLWLALDAAFTRIADPIVGWSGFALAFALITSGLLSSTFHLGHPERAWRALSQWRSSWLSREGMMAIITYLPALVFAFGWLLLGRNDGIWLFAGFLGGLASLVTVFCTSMIYRSLKTIPHWNTDFTVRIYILLAVASGGLFLSPILLIAESSRSFIFTAVVTALLLFRTGMEKLRFWRAIDNRAEPLTPGDATGLSALGTVRLLEGPTTSETYVMREMGYRIGRKHAAKLRRIYILLGMIAPSVLLLLAAWLQYAAPAHAMELALCLTALLAGSFGILVERWLFFAEAKHVSTLYYGAESV